MKQFHSIKRRYLTLMEMMIVIFIIGLLMGVLAYNYTGTMEKGKAFKTKSAIERVEGVLNLAIAQNPSLENEVEKNWQSVVKSSSMVSNPDALIKDGWGQDFEVTVDRGVVKVRSSRLEEYQRKHPAEM